jgi:hypothetical protein
VDSIFSRIVAWEEERGKAFLYDGVCLFTVTTDFKDVVVKIYDCFTCFLPGKSSFCS